MTITASTAPDLNSIDGLSAFERACRQPMMLGLFLPIQNGGWTPSTVPRGTDWSFDYNARLVVRAEEVGFDLVFGLAQWLGAEGWGGATRYRRNSLDPMLVTSGVAALTRNIMLISTIHVLYGWHPLHLAKFGATLDHMTGGRWGLNLVTGFHKDEIAMFGLPRIEHDARYDMAAEFTEMVERLWREEADVTWAGDYWSLEEAFASPKPVRGRPVMVNAGSSDAGIAYAARYSDLIFITSPGGADIDAALDSLPAHTRRIKAEAARHGREVRTIINPMIICRESEAEVRAARDRILAGEDGVAVDNLMGGFAGGDQTSWRGHRREQRIIGGNLQLFGTPEQIVDWFVKLKAAGCDGMQIAFVDFAPELEHFAERILPLMREAGLRNDAAPVG